MKRSFVVCLVCVALTFPALANSARASEPVKITATHPLEPLSALEMKAAYEIVKARFTSDPDLPDKLRFPMLVLSEPPKQTVLAWKTGDTFPRVAHVEVLHNESNRTWVALVDLRQAKLVSIEQIPEGAQPALTESENVEADAIIRAYKPWQDAMRARGVNPDLAYLDIWAPGDTPLPDEVAAQLPYGQNTRLLRYLVFDRGAKLDAFDPLAPQNPYDRPVEGVVVTVDMNAGAVVHMTDTVVHPVSTESGNAPARVMPKPLMNEQLQGSDIDRQGRLVRWHNWQFYVALHPREGLVLYDVRFADQGTLRPIAYRMALSEIYVFYGLGDENWVWRSAFDVGEYNAGIWAQALKVNGDIPENAELLDAVFFSDTGPGAANQTGTHDLPATVALYERDAGILWSRTDPEQRRSRHPLRARAGGYLELLDRQLHLRLRLDLQARRQHRDPRRCSPAPHSIAAPTPRPKPRRPRSASTEGGARGRTQPSTLPQLPAGSRRGRPAQSLDGDGGRASARHRLQELVRGHQQHIKREGFRDANPFALRHWHVEGSSTNAFGKPTSYALEPGGVAVPYSAPDFPGLDARRLCSASAVGDEVSGGRAVRRRNLPQSGQDSRRLARVREGRSQPGEAGRGGLVHRGLHARDAARGFSGDVRRDHRLSPSATRVLHAQSRPRRRRSELVGALAAR